MFEITSQGHHRSKSWVGSTGRELSHGADVIFCHRMSKLRSDSAYGFAEMRCHMFTCLCSSKCQSAKCYHSCYWVLFLCFFFKAWNITWIKKKKSGYLAVAKTTRIRFSSGQIFLGSTLSFLTPLFFLGRNIENEISESEDWEQKL